MPPLRERKDDILTLLEYFVQRMGRKLGKTFSKIDKRGNACLSLRTAGRVASGRSFKRHSRKVEVGFTVPTELQPSFEYLRQLLITKSRNCKLVRAASNSAEAVCP
jgi:hypothetical protein